ncbi:2-hydroxyacid dehydrogenase [Filimonas effusa]|uniref:Glyoxylate/hydroxypyruvate reductase B n=1 Tax=Filimonas effusa TaxID=2508721 RepID=A0A4Q1CZ99_9BACT|nr:D-glycerate dehydrogenase [Filimonas effusa]RXK80593.1 D-glycerate dehydrogenase [Filimonas effusa]
MKIFITRIIPAKGLQLLKDAGHTITQYEEKRPLTQEELIEACSRHDALLSVGPNKLDETFFSRCKHLKAISLLSVGYDNVDVAAANKYRMAIGNTPGVLSGATADTAFLLMLAVSRKAFFLSNKIGRGEWGFFEPTAGLGIELNNKTLGIFGLGRIGMELAKKSIGAYNMNIIYHNRHHNEVAEKELGARYVSFEELLRESDVLSVHANLSPETKGVFNANTFSQMKSSAIFINTARGGLHNEEDLTAAVKNGTIWGAGLDVTNPEPMKPDSPLLTMPTVCILPHIGSATMETRDAMSEIAARNILAALAGEKMPHAINPEVYKQQVV